jgi:2,4-dienoyl-CoA reductase-like NADH-dependent reductase (Old Yellow Enzyme family)
MLFSEQRLNQLLLENRVGLAPMTRVSATEDGRATERMTRYYRKFADGGFSFLVTEGTYPDEEYGQAYLNQPGLATDDHVEAWKSVTDAVSDSSTPIFAQLMHAGAQTQGNIYTGGDETIAPSPVQPDREKNPAYSGEGEYPVPREATADDLDAVRAGFVRAAKHAEKAGFDGVELHAANGYLLHEFLSTAFNHRDDEYGGAPANRIRFPKEVASAVREAVPEEFVVGVRISQTAVTIEDCAWPEGEDAARIFCSEFADAGVDYIHTTEPDATEPTFAESGRTLAEAANEYTPDETVIIDNGGLGDPEAAREKLKAGADLVTLARSALVNADWPKRVAEGRELAEFEYSMLFTPKASIGDHELPDGA